LWLTLNQQESAAESILAETVDGHLDVSHTGGAVTEQVAPPVEVADDDDGIPTDDDCNGVFQFDGFGQNKELKPPKLSSYAHAWGVVASWLHDSARDALWRGIIACSDEEERPDIIGRRDLLCEILLERIPGELSFLRDRFLEVVRAFQLHETLPSVTEVVLYDLLAALIVRAIWRADTERGIRPRDPYVDALVVRRLEHAAQVCQIQAVELKALEIQLGANMDASWSVGTLD